MASNDACPETVYLQPHLLTKSALINMLEEKFMNISHLNTMSKEQLVELFERIALPLPQRKYKQNRRGKLLTKLRNEKQCQSSKAEEKSSNVSFGFGENTCTQSRSSSGLGDRLKPPPDAVNYERKKIKLSNTSAAGSSKTDGLDHIQIKKRKVEDKNGLIKELKEESSRDHKSNTEDKANGSQKIVLKRSHSASLKVSTDTSEPEKKKEKKLITWP